MEYSYGSGGIIINSQRRPGSKGKWVGSRCSSRRRGVRIRVSNKKKSSQRLGSYHWACLGLGWAGLSRAGLGLGCVALGG